MALPKLRDALGHSDDGVNAMAIYAFSQIAAVAPEMVASLQPTVRIQPASQPASQFNRP